VTTIAKAPNDDLFLGTKREIICARFFTGGLIFLLSYAILFLGMTRRPSIFDEGFVLTAAMRVGAGQIPHRDFYILYGPAQLYLLAGLFRLSGHSIFIERLFDLFSKALVVTSVYALTSVYCRRSIAACTSVIALFWLFSLSQWPGSPVVPASLLNIVGSALIVPVFWGMISTGRMFTVGTVAGLAALFRYDTGIALVVTHACAISIAVYLQGGELSSNLRRFASIIWPYLLGFAVFTLPPLIYYFSVAPLGPLVHDMILYPARYYHRGRNLPFPGVHVHTIENLGIYTPIAIAGLSLYLAGAAYLHARKNAFDFKETLKQQSWLGFLVTFALLTVAMYLKGLVRVSLFQMYLAIVPSLVLIAVLFVHRFAFSLATRISIICLACLSLLAAASAAFHQAKGLYLGHLSVAEYISSSVRGVTPQAEANWCKTNNSLTMRFCFLPEDQSIQTIEFISSHTRPDQQIYVGLIKHDKIFANDNMIYFATQRLPATKWSELDPDLESRYDVQEQMVHEFEMKTPPYIVLDSEFATMQEPNDSSRSSGVTLLDEYIRNTYKQIETFGQMSIWQRRFSGGPL
jgi:hypothetical protein